MDILHRIDAATVVMVVVQQALIAKGSSIRIATEVIEPLEEDLQSLDTQTHVC